MSVPMTNILVSVDDQYLGNIQQIACQLQALGMSIVDVLSTTGIITGSIATSAFAKVKQIPGVLSVEEDEVFSVS